MSTFPPRCYYCNERHVVVRHLGLPGYPGPADIEFYKLKKQGMYWEREIKTS